MTRRSKTGTRHVVLGEVLFLDRSTLPTKARRLFGTSGATVQTERRHVSRSSEWCAMVCHIRTFRPYSRVPFPSDRPRQLLLEHRYCRPSVASVSQWQHRYCRRCLTVEAPILQAVSRRCLTVEAPLLQAVSRRCLTVEASLLQAVSRRCFTVSDVSDWFYV